MNGKSNESVYNKFDTSSRGGGIECVVIDWVRHGTLRWFGQI